MEIDVLGALYLVTGLSKVLPDGETRLDAPPPSWLWDRLPNKEGKRRGTSKWKFFFADCDLRIVQIWLFWFVIWKTTRKQAFQSSDILSLSLSLSLSGYSSSLSLSLVITHISSLMSWLVTACGNNRVMQIYLEKQLSNTTGKAKCKTKINNKKNVMKV